MSKKGQKIDDLLDLLKDDRVMEVLISRLTTSITPAIEGVFNSFVEAFSTKLESLVERSTQELINKHCEALHIRIASLESENDLLKSRLNETENNLRLDSLVIHGLREAPKNPDSSADSVATQAVLDLCSDQLGLEIAESDISYAFRIPSNAKDRSRPMIVSFVSRRVRNMVYSSRKTLRGSSKPGAQEIYINEHLTKTNAQIYAKARNLVKEKRATSTWTTGGIVYLRQSESVNERPKKIASLKSLEDL